RFVAFCLPGTVRYVEINGEAGHVLHEKIDCRTALHGEDVVIENIRGNGQQQADRIRVGFIHEDSGSVKYRREAGSSTAWRYPYVSDSALTPHRRLPPLFPGPRRGKGERL